MGTMGGPQPHVARDRNRFDNFGPCLISGLHILMWFGFIWPFPCSSHFSSEKLLFSGLNNGGRQLCHPLEPSKSMA